MPESGGREISNASSTEVRNTTATQQIEKVGRGRALASALRDKLRLGKKSEGTSSPTHAKTVLHELARTEPADMVSFADRFAEVIAIRKEFANDPTERRRRLALVEQGGQPTSDATHSTEQGELSPTTAAVNSYAEKQRGRIAEAYDNITHKHIKPALMVLAGTAAYFVSSALTNSSSGQDIGWGMLGTSALMALGIANETRKANRDQAALDQKKNKEQNMGAPELKVVA